MLYLAVVVLVIRTGLTRQLAFDLPGIHASFLVPIVYALVTIAVIAVLKPYPQYSVADSVIFYKTKLVDPFLFFVLFFYGASTLVETERLANAYLLALVIGAAAMLLAVLGVASFGDPTIERGRAGGVPGLPNDFAGFSALLLPPFLAASVLSRGLRRLAWFAGAFAAFAAFVRVFLSAFEPLRADWAMPVTMIAVATMVVGTVVGVAQSNAKRMLAYSNDIHGGDVYQEGAAAYRDREMLP